MSGWGPVVGGRLAEGYSVHSKYIEDLKAHLVIIENFSPDTYELKESLALMTFGLIGNCWFMSVWISSSQ